MKTAQTDSAGANRPTKWQKFFRWIERLLACTGICFLIYHVGFELIVMTSGSMAPGLQGTSYDNGDRILVERVSKHWRKPKRWEIYFMYDAEGTAVAKRIVGLVMNVPSTSIPTSATM